MQPTIIRHRQSPEIVVAVHVHAGIVQDKVRAELIEVARQPVRQTPEHAMQERSMSGPESEPRKHFG